MFAYLTLRRMDTLARAAWYATLWGDRPPAAADAALGALLSRLRQAVARVADRHAVRHRSDRSRTARQHRAVKPGSAAAM